MIDDTMRALGHASHRHAGVSNAEVLTVAVVAGWAVLGAQVVVVA